LRRGRGEGAYKFGLTFNSKGMSEWLCEVEPIMKCVRLLTLKT